MDRGHRLPPLGSKIHQKYGKLGISGCVCTRELLLTFTRNELPWWLSGKESAWNAGALGSIPGLGRPPVEGNSYPLQYSGLENSMDCIVHAAAAAAKSLQSCPTLCNLKDCSSPGSSAHGILQARILEWVAMPFSRGSSRPRDQICTSCISCIGRQVLYH